MMDTHTLESCQTCPTRVVCRCLQVTEDIILDALRRHGVTSLKELRQLTGAGEGCTCCHPDLRRLMEEVSQPSSSLPICSVK